VKIWQIYHLVYGVQARDPKIPSLLLHDSSKIIPSHDKETSNSLFTPPSRALVPHLSAIAAPSLEWMTVLSIYDTPLERRDWTRLAGLANLGALHVENWNVRTGAVDDVVIREWARAAREDGAFSQLRLVLLRNQAAITMGVLDDFAYFPALRVLHLASSILGEKQARDRVRDKRWIWKD
jgi:hypothetical protein